MTPEPEASRNPAGGFCAITVPAPVGLPLSLRPDSESSSSAVVAGRPTTLGTVTVLSCAVPVDVDEVDDEHAVSIAPAIRTAAADHVHLTFSPYLAQCVNALASSLSPTGWLAHVVRLNRQSALWPRAGMRQFDSDRPSS